MLLKKDFYSRLRKKVEVIDLLMVMVIIVLCLVSLLSYSLYKKQIDQTMLFYGGLGLFFVIAFLELVPQLLSPHIFFIVSLSYLGVFEAVILAIFASVFGGVLGFELGRKYGWRFIYPFFEEKNIERIYNNWQKYGKWWVLFSAFTPLPYIPLIYGSLGLSRKEFLIYGLLARVLSFIILGYGAYYGFFKL
jgi:undecaprenyl-diphosphatase